jgi:hypothetical protein
MRKEKTHRRDAKNAEKLFIKNNQILYVLRVSTVKTVF